MVAGGGQADGVTVAPGWAHYVSEFVALLVNQQWFNKYTELLIDLKM